MACKLCKNLVISTAVDTNTSGSLVVTIPSGSYASGHRYCIVVAQSIPSATTITAPVYIQIGTGETLYPLNAQDGNQVIASALRTRTRYAVIVSTTPTSGSFNLLGKICCSPNYNLNALPG